MIDFNVPGSHTKNLTLSYVVAVPAQCLQHVDAADLWHAEIKDDAAQWMSRERFKQRRSRSIQYDIVTRRAQETAYALPGNRVIIDDSQHNRLLFGRSDIPSHCGDVRSAPCRSSARKGEFVIPLTGACTADGSIAFHAIQEPLREIARICKTP